ncbi:MAG: aspartate kinase [Deltaproteobacteria bacterium]|nr:aspartate kinase [Deltaproteobacteria bacterium]
MSQELAPIVVQKYGGSSVADPERLRKVAVRVAETVRRGYRVVVVVSAMGRTTDQLLELARSVSASPPRRELDMLLSAGERISAALLAIAISDQGCDAVSFTGSQCGIITSHRHTDARILEVRPYRVQDELDRGRVVIIAGFQGVSYKRDITTLGRGGSDTTAVAMAAALGAEYCEICSDVDGVYTADPRVVPSPRHLSTISYAEMQELALHGAKVLNAQAVEFARKQGIVIFARASSGSERQTRVAATSPERGGGAVGVAGLSQLLCVRGAGGAEQLSQLGEVLRSFQLAPLWAHLHEGRPVLFLHGSQCVDSPGLVAALEKTGPIELESGLEAASVVGEGLGDDPGHLAALLELARELELPVHSVDTAPLRLTLVLRPGHLARAQQALHARFVEQEHAPSVDVVGETQP